MFTVSFTYELMLLYTRSSKRFLILFLILQPEIFSTASNRSLSEAHPFLHWYFFTILNLGFSRAA